MADVSSVAPVALAVAGLVAAAYVIQKLFGENEITSKPIG